MEMKRLPSGAPISLCSNKQPKSAPPEGEAGGSGLRVVIGGNGRHPGRSAGYPDRDRGGHRDGSKRSDLCPGSREIPIVPEPNSRGSCNRRSTRIQPRGSEEHRQPPAYLRRSQTGLLARALLPVPMRQPRLLHPTPRRVCARTAIEHALIADSECASNANLNFDSHVCNLAARSLHRNRRNRHERHR